MSSYELVAFGVIDHENITNIYQIMCSKAQKIVNTYNWGAIVFDSLGQGDVYVPTLNRTVKILRYMKVNVSADNHPTIIMLTRYHINLVINVLNVDW